jgi:hypothetical protein
MLTSYPACISLQKHNVNDTERCIIIFLDLEFSFESSGLKLLLGTKHRNIYNISSVIKDKGGKNA